MYDYNGTATSCSYYENKLPRVTKTGKHTTTHTYDDMGQLLTISDGAGTTRYGFDKYNRLTSVTDHAENKTTYTYDNVGNKASQINPDGSVTTLRTTPATA